MIKVNTEITIDVKETECGSDAIDRYMKHNKLIKNVQIITDSCKTVFYMDNINDHKYFIGSQELSIDGKKVTFTIVLDY